MGAIDMTNPNVHHRKQRNNSHNRPSSAERNKQRATRGRVNPAPRAAVRPSLLGLRKLFNFCKALSNFRAALLFREEEVQSGRCWLDEEIENQPAPTNAAAAENSAATHQQLKRQQRSQKKEKKGGKGGQPRIYPVYRAPAMPQPAAAAAANTSISTESSRTRPARDDTNKQCRASLTAS